MGVGGTSWGIARGGEQESVGGGKEEPKANEGFFQKIRGSQLPCTR